MKAVIIEDENLIAKELEFKIKEVACFRKDYNYQD